MSNPAGNVTMFSVILTAVDGSERSAGVLGTPPQAWRGILEAGDRLNADLIVIGSHGYSGRDRVLGTTAANVVNRADRSVLVVHDRP